ncbi:polyamine ABC transporter substrate-binding protein [Pseudomonas sp. gcc21]|uniref:polyamine ABC transporter substrate-binding protein n=1 Tax=Pseudomonas sp. gcc21 TaxID=2726989 RepID=UPI001451A03D|nr:polyamine ABC transporter substrate-binding protein [Pseudomonas sp. gcc21]QJD59561.1 polyamine ABC transporter substrate-binding protein [Pseudomonas sp. gcc21]
MKNSVQKTFLALATAALLGGAATAQANGQLKVFNWSDYIAEDTIANFEKETGIDVSYDVYDSNEVLDARLLTGRSGFDLVVPSNHFLSKQIDAGVYMELDHDKLPNMKHLDPLLMEQIESIDPGSKHSIPYMWGTNGIGYNVEKVKAVLGDDAPVDSWDLVFKPEVASKLASCGITMLDSGDDMITSALGYLRLDPNSTDKDDLKKAEDLLLSVRESVRYFHSSRYISDLANGDICVAVGFSGDVFQAAARAEEVNNNVNIAYTIPKEGTQLWFDMMAIPKDAPNPDNAHTFINYILRPDVVAPITDYVAYANPNKAANELIDAEILNDPAIYPTEEVMQKLYVAEPRPLAAQRIITRSWNRIKSGR